MLGNLHEPFAKLHELGLVYVDLARELRHVMRRVFDLVFGAAVIIHVPPLFVLLVPQCAQNAPHQNARVQRMCFASLLCQIRALLHEVDEVLEPFTILLLEHSSAAR